MPRAIHIYVVHNEYVVRVSNFSFSKYIYEYITHIDL